MRQLNRPEPKPKGVDGTPIWELVVKDMRTRDEMGEKKYGHRLRAGNGRDALVDAYQEVLDLAVYLRQKIEEDSSRAVNLHDAFLRLEKRGRGLGIEQTHAILEAVGLEAS